VDRAPQPRLGAVKLYEELAGHISGLIADGTLRSGERCRPYVKWFVSVA